LATAAALTPMPLRLTSSCGLLLPPPLLLRGRRQGRPPLLPWPGVLAAGAEGHDDRVRRGNDDGDDEEHGGRRRSGVGERSCAIGLGWSRVLGMAPGRSARARARAPSTHEHHTPALFLCPTELCGFGLCERAVFVGRLQASEMRVGA